jgi:uncharacterized membrane protein
MMSERRLYAVSLFLALLGLAVSGYLSYVKLFDAPMMCIDGVFQCDAIQQSAYAELAGVPVAILGLLSYVVITALLFFQNRNTFLEENGIALLLGLVFFSWLYSMYLVYVQASVLQAWCQWCVVHEIIITVLLIVTGIRFKHYMDDDWVEEEA